MHTFSTLGRCWIALPLLLSTVPVFAQDATDVYLASIERTDEGVTLTQVRNLTDRDGYDNQPAFSKDGSTLYYTRMEGTGDEVQTDIWQIELAAEKAEPRVLFSTPESEYSPTLVPGADALSVIRVEGDGSQKLWRLPLDGKPASRILDDVAPVGYHAWAGDELVLFVLGEPHELQRVRGDKASNRGRVVAKDIGRALKKIPDQDAFSFVQKTVEGKEGWWIQRISIEGDEITPLIQTFKDREDFTWSPDRKLWMADGSKIFRWCPACGEGWWPVADLSDQGIENITRMAVSPDGHTLAFVAGHRKAGDKP